MDLKNRPYIIVAASLIIAVALLSCGFLIRDGLLTVSMQVRDNQASPLPAEVRLVIGNPDIKVTLGSIKIDGVPPDRNNNVAATGTLSIDNIKIEVPASQPATRGSDRQP